MFNEKKLFEVNREERHFGFILFSALIYNVDFRIKFFDLVKERLQLSFEILNPNFYTELCILRDYWFDLGNHKKYSKELHDNRMSIIKLMLQEMKVSEEIINDYKMFWTGEINGKKSKLWFPGKWAKKEIIDLQNDIGCINDEIFRIRWACNAKPDLLITSDLVNIFIEIKVESGFGGNSEGYVQLQTQQDIISLVSRIVPNMNMCSHLTITQKHVDNKTPNINWSELINLFSEVEIKMDGDMIVKSHLNNMPYN